MIISEKQIACLLEIASQYLHALSQIRDSAGLTVAGQHNYIVTENLLCTDNVHHLRPIPTDQCDTLVLVL